MSAIEHLVLVQWAESADVAARDRVRAMSRSLPDRIPGILAVTEGPSMSPEELEGGIDWALIVRFDSVASRDAYLPHPEHRPLADLIGSNAARVIVVDVAAD